MTTLLKTWLIAIFFIVTVDLSAQTDKKSLSKVTFTPQWTPQAQFAGYYMAKEKGFYKKRGLEVVINHANPDHSAADALKKGKADFITLFLSSGIKLRVSDIKLVNISQISQESALVIVTRKSSGIKAPSDLNGKKFGLWKSDFQDIPNAFFQKQNIKPQIVPIASGVNLFLWGGLDAVITMYYNEYHTIINHGINEDELNAFFFSKCGFNAPEDGIYCLESKLATNKHLCKKFVDASIEGWNYVKTHEKETLEVICRIMREAHVPVNLAHQQWMLSAIIKLIFPNRDANRIGHLSKKQYEETAKMLLDSNVITRIPDYTVFYRPE